MAKARPKFSTPRDQVVDEREVPAGAPPVVEECKYLREIKSGRIHPYTELMARRGDLVEAYDGEPPTEEEERAAALAERDTAAKAKPVTSAAPAAPAPPAPPKPPAARKRAAAPVNDPLGPPLEPQTAAITHEAAAETA